MGRRKRASQPDLFAPAPPDPAAAGFWVAPLDAARRLGEVAGEGGALAAACSLCGHARRWPAAALARLPADMAVRELAARLVCGAAGCGSHLGTLAVLRPGRAGRPARRRHLSDRDVARIRAMAAQVRPGHQPPILDDLDAPIRVGACLPGGEAYLGAAAMTAWNGRVILAWPLGRKARNARRAPDGLA